MIQNYILELTFLIDINDDTLKYILKLTLSSWLIQVKIQKVEMQKVDKEKLLTQSHFQLPSMLIDIFNYQNKYLLNESIQV